MVFKSTAERAFRRFSLRVLKKITMIANSSQPPKRTRWNSVHSEISVRMQRWPAASITSCTSDFCVWKSGWSSKICLAQHDVTSRSHFGLQSMRRRVNATFHKYLLHTLWHIWKFGMIRQKDHGLGNFLPISDVPAILHGLGQPFPVWVVGLSLQQKSSGGNFFQYVLKQLRYFLCFSEGQGINAELNKHICCSIFAIN